MDKVLNEIRKIIYKQNENINKQIEILQKKKHTEILELKNTTIKLKILLEKFTIRLEQIEEKNQ